MQCGAGLVILRPGDAKMKPDPKNVWPGLAEVRQALINMRAGRATVWPGLAKGSSGLANMMPTLERLRKSETPSNIVSSD